MATTAHTQQEEILEGLAGTFIQMQLHFLKPVEQSWQPSDYLPDLSAENWKEELDVLRGNAATLSDELLVVLVGNIVTEEALPSYQTWLNRNRGLKDVSGADDTPWAVWTRGWTAEEKRHGDLLSKYLYLSGRVDMRSVEVTVQHLIRNGFDLKSDNDPYKALVYASFQERGTKISHFNTGRLAEKCGDPLLARICSVISGDEARHEEAYKRIFAKILEADTEKALLAFASMMRRKVVMPARLMDDGRRADLFSRFAVVAQRSGVYTSRAYADVISHLVEYWGIASLSNLSPAGLDAQEYLCALAGKVLEKADKTESIVGAMPKEPFAWIFDRVA